MVKIFRSDLRDDPALINRAWCRAEVKHKDGSYAQCSRNATTARDADGLRFCLQHDPVFQQRKREAKAAEQQAYLDRYSRGVNEQVKALRWRQRMEPLVTDTVRLLAEVERSDCRTLLDERLVQARHALVKVLVELRE